MLVSVSKGGGVFIDVSKGGVLVYKGGILIDVSKGAGGGVLVDVSKGESWLM